MRELVLDTETTGLDPTSGDRLVEIGAVEVYNYIPTGKTYHVYINPERSMPTAAFEVHGLSEEFLRDKPVFAAIAEEFLQFLAADRVVIHNAAFDIGFLNMELARAGLPVIAAERIVDTLALARLKHPSGPNSLDALCSRYGIDNSRRTKHGALLDAELLADVYLELKGGRQAGLGLQTLVEAAASRSSAPDFAYVAKVRPAPLIRQACAEEAQAHAALVEAMGEAALWRKYSNV